MSLRRKSDLTVSNNSDSESGGEERYLSDSQSAEARCENKQNINTLEMRQPISGQATHTRQEIES